MAKTEVDRVEGTKTGAIQKRKRLLEVRKTGSLALGLGVPKVRRGYTFQDRGAPKTAAACPSSGG